MPQGVIYIVAFIIVQLLLFVSTSVCLADIHTSVVTSDIYVHDAIPNYVYGDQNLQG